MLSDMVQACQPNPSLSNLCLMAAYLLGFAPFLRYNEFFKLLCEDLVFTPNFLQDQPKLINTVKVTLS